MGRFMLYRAEQVVPLNYRTNAFHLFDQDLNIGGMARPNYNNQNTETTLTHLSQILPDSILIGLYEKYDFSSEAAAAGLNYVFIPVKDYEITPPEIYDNIYAAVKEATSDGHQVTIHCGAGNGRTGAALVALKLREMLETAAKEDPSILDEAPDPAATNVLLSELLIDYPCSALVKVAIESIRQNRSTFNNSENGTDSIESPTDIASLLLYETHLRQLIKQELDESGLDCRSGFHP
jgi:hypothetical protein